MLNSKVKMTIAAGLLALPTLALTPFAAFAGKDNFTVQNANRRVNLVRLFVSSAAQRTWNNDVLGTDILRPGERTEIIFGDRSSEQCLYDFRAEFSDGGAAEEFRFDVCRNRGIVFY